MENSVFSFCLPFENKKKTKSLPMKVQTTLRIEKAAFEQCREYGKMTNRSLNNTMENFIIEGLKMNLQNKKSSEE